MVRGDLNLPWKMSVMQISVHIYLPGSASYILRASYFNDIDLTLLFLFVSKFSEKFWTIEFILFITAFSYSCSKDLKLHTDGSSSLQFLYFPKIPAPNYIPVGILDTSDSSCWSLTKGIQLKVTKSHREFILLYRKLGYRQWRKGSET